MKMKSIVKKSSLIICICINLLILINIVQSLSSIKDLRYNDSGQCELNGLIVEPGERLNHPDECLQVVCFRDGSGRGKVNNCPWDPDAEYLDTTLPYPKCCKVKQSKSYKQFKTYYRRPGGETSRVNKQLQNTQYSENSEQELTVNNDFDDEKPIRKPIFKTTPRPQLISRPTINSIESEENKPIKISEKPYTAIQRTRRPAVTRPTKPSDTIYQRDDELNENEPEAEIQQFAAATRFPTTIRRTTTVKSTETAFVNLTEENADDDISEIIVRPSPTPTTTTTVPITTTEAIKIETTTEEQTEEKQEVNNVDDNKEKEEENFKPPLRRINLRRPISKTKEEEKEEEQATEINNVADNKEEKEENVKPTLRPINFRRPRPTPTETGKTKITTAEQKEEEQKSEINDFGDNKEEKEEIAKPTLRPINFRRPRPTTTETDKVKITIEEEKDEEQKDEINDADDNKEEPNENVKPTLRPIIFRRARPTTTETPKFKTTTEVQKDEEEKSEINDVVDDKDEEETVKVTLRPISSRRPRPFQRNVNTLKETTPIPIETEENASTPSSRGRPRPSRAQVSRNIRAKITSGGNAIDNENDENYPSWYKNKNSVPRVLTTEESTEIAITEMPDVDIGGITDRKIPLRFRLKTTDDTDEESNTETNVSEHVGTNSSQRNFESESDETFRLSKELTDKENTVNAIKAESETESEVKASEMSEQSSTEKSESENISSENQTLPSREQLNQSLEPSTNIESILEEKIDSTESIISTGNEIKNEDKEINSDERIKLNSESKSIESSADNINSNLQSTDILIPVQVVAEPNEINSTFSPSATELESETKENANDKLSKREDTQKQIKITDDVFQKINDESDLNLEQQKDEPVFNIDEINEYQQRSISHTTEDDNDSKQKFLLINDLKYLNKIIENDSASEGQTILERKESENLNKDSSITSSPEKFHSNLPFNNENTKQKLIEYSLGSIGSINSFNSKQSSVNKESDIDGSIKKSENNEYLEQLLFPANASENNVQKEINEQLVGDVEHSIGVTDPTFISSNIGQSVEIHNNMPEGDSTQVNSQKELIETQQKLINSDLELKDVLREIDSKNQNSVKEIESYKQQTTQDLNVPKSIHSNQDETVIKNNAGTESQSEVNYSKEINERQKKLLGTDGDELNYVLKKNNLITEDFIKEAEHFKQKITAEIEKTSVEGSPISETASNSYSFETQQKLSNSDTELKEILQEIASKIEILEKENESSKQKNTADLKDSKSFNSTQEHSDYNQVVVVTEHTSIQDDNKESFETQQKLLRADAELKGLIKQTASTIKEKLKETESSQTKANDLNVSTSTDSVQVQTENSQKMLQESSSIQEGDTQKFIETTQEQTVADLKFPSLLDSPHTLTSETEKVLTEEQSFGINNSQEPIETQQQLLGSDAELKDLLNEISSKTEAKVKQTENTQQKIEVDLEDSTSSYSIQTHSGNNDHIGGSSIFVNTNQGLIDESTQKSADNLKVSSTGDLIQTQSSGIDKIIAEGSSTKVNNNQESIETQHQLLRADDELKLNEISSKTEEKVKETENLQQQIAVDSTSTDSIQTQKDNKKILTESDKVLSEDSSLQVNNNKGFIGGSQHQTVAHDLTRSHTSETDKVLTEGSSVQINNNQESIETQQQLLGADAELKHLLNEIKSKTEENLKETESSQQHIAADSISTDSIQTQSGNNKMLTESEKVLTERSTPQVNNNEGFIGGSQQQIVAHDLTHSHTSETDKILTGGSSIQINNNQESIETQQQLLGADAELKHLLNEIKSETEEKLKETESSQHQIAVDSFSTDSIQTQNGNNKILTENEKMLTEGSTLQVNNNEGFIGGSQQQTVTHDLTHSHTSETDKVLTGGSSIQINNNQNSSETQQQLLEADAELKHAKNEMKSETEEKLKETESSQHQIAVDSFSTDSIQTQNGNNKMLTENEKMLTEGSTLQVNNNEEFIGGSQQQTVTHDLTHSHTSETDKVLTGGSSIQINNNQKSSEAQQQLLEADAELKHAKNEMKSETEEKLKETESSQHQIAVDSILTDSIRTQNDNNKMLTANEKKLTEGSTLQVNNNEGFFGGSQQQTVTHDLTHSHTSETDKVLTGGSSIHTNNNQESIETQQQLLGADAELKDLLKEIGSKSSSESQSTQQQQQQQITVDLNGLAQLKNTDHTNIETQQTSLNEDEELKQLLLDLESKRHELNSQHLETGDGELKQLLQEIQTDKNDDFQQRSLRNNKEGAITPIYFRAPGRYRIVRGELIPVQLYLD